MKCGSYHFVVNTWTKYISNHSRVIAGCHYLRENPGSIYTIHNTTHSMTNKLALYVSNTPKRGMGSFCFMCNSLPIHTLEHGVDHDVLIYARVCIRTCEKV